MSIWGVAWLLTIMCAYVVPIAHAGRVYAPNYAQATAGPLQVPDGLNDVCNFAPCPPYAELPGEPAHEQDTLIIWLDDSELAAAVADTRYAGAWYHADCPDTDIGRADGIIYFGATYVGEDSTNEGNALTFVCDRQFGANGASGIYGDICPGQAKYCYPFKKDASTGQIVGTHNKTIATIVPGPAYVEAASSALITYTYAPDYLRATVSALQHGNILNGVSYNSLGENSIDMDLLYMFLPKRDRKTYTLLANALLGAPDITVRDTVFAIEIADNAVARGPTAVFANCTVKVVYYAYDTVKARSVQWSILTFPLQRVADVLAGDNVNNVAPLNSSDTLATSSNDLALLWCGRDDVTWTRIWPVWSGLAPSVYIACAVFVQQSL